MENVFVVFKINEIDNGILWKIFNSQVKAENWINEHGQWAKFEWEKWQVR